MFYRVVFLLFLFFKLLNASYEEIKIGKIDDIYANKITEEQLRNIIEEIEENFETTLNINIFDYSENGKPIDILYLPPSKLEKTIEKKTLKLRKKENKLKKLQNYFAPKQKEIMSLEKTYKAQNILVNKKIRKLNSYIKEINKFGVKSNEEYAKIKEYTKKQKLLITKDTKNLKSVESNLRRNIIRFNNKVISYNNTVNEMNYLVKQIESMNRNNKKVKGMTFGLKQIVLQTSYKDGKKTITRSIKKSMNKIEIYGFESLSQLKAILAHEIGHLVGIPHIKVKGALMNPVLQENQVTNLQLTNEDIENFIENYEIVQSFVKN